MSDEKNRCPSCQGTGWDETGSFAEQGHVECTDCGGTGRDVARAGVGCAGLVGPLDGTNSEGITANMGIMRYDLWTPIPKLLEQIRVNEARMKRPNDQEHLSREKKP